MIIICQQAIYLGGTAATSANASTYHRGAMNDGPTGYESPGAKGRSLAVAAKDHDVSHSPETSQDYSSFSASSTKAGSRSKIENEETSMMSGLSLTMLSEDGSLLNSCPHDDMMVNSPSITNNEQHENFQEDFSIPMFGSPVTRAAFHSPPPLPPDVLEDEMLLDQGKSFDTLQKSPFTVPSTLRPRRFKIDGLMNGLNDAIYTFSEVTSSPTLSPLLERCTKEGRPQLKMIESPPRKGRLAGGSGQQPSLNDRLSDFRSFGASL